ncbi:MAG: ArsR/SmtB family transcription factor [Bryobacteraceae bacterium]
MTQLSVFFKALADPTRLRIINLLLRSPLCVCEMAATLRLPQPLLSRHLAYLRNSGLVEGFRQGLRINYELNQRHPLIPLIRPFLEEAFRGEAAAQMDLKNLKADAAVQEDELA